MQDTKVQASRLCSQQTERSAIQVQSIAEYTTANFVTADCANVDV